MVPATPDDTKFSGERNESTGQPCCQLLLGQEPSDQSIGVAVPQLVLDFEMADELHVLERAGFLEDLHPVGYGFAVLLLDGRKVGGRTFDRYSSRHFDSLQSLL